MKRFLSLLLTAAMLLCLCACSGPYTGKLGSDVSYYNFPNPYLTDSDEDLLKKIPAPEATLDVQQIYSSLTYDERMFYGDYRLYDQEKDQPKYAQQASYRKLNVADYSGSSKEYSLSTLPVTMRVGPTNVELARYNRQHQWAQLQFCVEGKDYTMTLVCTYTVSGRTITFTPVEYLLTLCNEEYRVTGYEYTLGQESFSYSFAFSGPRITFSDDSGSITLCSAAFTKGRSPQIGGHLASDSPMVGPIDHFHGYLNTDLFDAGATGYVAFVEGVHPYDYAMESCFRLYDNGLIDVYWVYRDENRNDIVNFKQFVYLGTYPMVLTDGETIYYYTENFITREMALMSDGMSTEELIEFENMSETQQKDVVQRKADLLKDLSEAFAKAGLDVQINTTTGEIALNAGVLFGYDQADLSEKGKTLLQDFLDVYTGVVLGDEYTDFVSRIIVEGHTDPVGDYNYNQGLSLRRAENVMAFCQSAESGLDAAQLELLSGILEAVGYSCDRPVYDENGQVDNDASRRVSFRFVINIGN